MAVIAVCGTGHDWYLCLFLTLTHSGDDDNQQQLCQARLTATVIISLEIGSVVMLLFVLLPLYLFSRDGNHEEHCVTAII